MRTFPFTVATAVGLPALITITRGIETIRFTTYETALVVGGLTWTPAPGAMLTNVAFPSDGSPATADIHVMAVTGGIVEPGDGARGTFDGWPITIEIVDPGNLAAGAYDMIPNATIGNVTEDTRGAAIIAVNGPLNRCRRQITEHYALTCRADLGDDRCKIPIRPADIARNTAYVLPSIATGLMHVDGAYGRVRSAYASPDISLTTVEAYHNLYWECTVAGTTAATAPNYTSSVGDVVVDGTATFIARNSWIRHARGQATGDFTIQLTALPDPRATDATWFVLGGIYVCSGVLDGFPIIPIRAWNPTTFEATTFLPVSTVDIPANTQMEIQVGCDLTRRMCFVRFDNIINMRAETFVPPTDPRLI